MGVSKGNQVNIPELYYNLVKRQLYFSDGEVGRGTGRSYLLFISKSISFEYDFHERGIKIAKSTLIFGVSGSLCSILEKPLEIIHILVYPYLIRIRSPR